MQTLLTIARQFIHGTSPLDARPLGNGLINDTFLVSSASTQLVLQRINRQVFPKPHWLMANLQALTQHVQQKPAQQVRLNIPAIIPTALQQPCVIDAHGDYWRALEFVPNSYSKEQLTGLADAEQIGWALGHFHALCSDLDANLLHDTLPGFHIAPDYLRDFQQALSVAGDKVHTDDSRFCLDYINSHQAIVPVLEAAKSQGVLTLRVMHGDPKMNNFLFDQHTQQIISLIDLDTVKPGLLHYDIGDCLRSCCHNSADDTFDLITAEVLLKSYLMQVRDFFSAADYHYLYPAIELIPFELGLRFFSDYLHGNRYFKVSHPEQNCQRAVQQFKLSASVRQQQSAIKALIQRVQ
ncbi:MAG: aminoglycoside phosphotransferase family protein [Methylococcales bacterium]|nr:aminoglycoside phosphotransferase family protein [Methylococcales bacterium]